ncbi:hypothetical protein SEMRO_2208_G319140.1 [Seminavis robusta]|uniref:Uncharacterized protein n=1 Tax=Seminavis robusta TaxID=568900 RepID=A0A9N8EW68_9STRA|nr:hypothetical protein SEMRO_2208_G319140.1 [Seminavis robusta]|eukprot:Sro2208_g319140.1 n/a (118) ;mRNA; f:12314-12667
MTTTSTSNLISNDLIELNNKTEWPPLVDTTAQGAGRNDTAKTCWPQRGDSTMRSPTVSISRRGPDLIIKATRKKKFHLKPDILSALHGCHEVPTPSHASAGDTYNPMIDTTESSAAP